MLINFFLKISFEITLFCLFVIVVYQIFQKYLFPFLQDQILLVKRKIKELQNKVSLLDASRQRLMDQISVQKVQFDSLEKKVIEWQKMQMDENQILEIKQKELQKKIKLKREQQLLNLKLLNMQENVSSRAIEQAYLEIKAGYSGQKGDELLGKLVDRISST